MSALGYVTLKVRVHETVVSRELGAFLRDWLLVGFLQKQQHSMRRRQSSIRVRLSQTREDQHKTTVRARHAGESTAPLSRRVAWALAVVLGTAHGTQS